MNTKKYLAMFAASAQKGELPQELYERLVAEVEADGKMTKRVYELYLSELEKRRLFDLPGAPADPKKSARTDGHYVYTRPKNPFWHLAHGLWSFIFKCIGYFGGAIVFGVWRVKDKKKLKGIGACITTSNHVGYLDAVLTLRARGFKRQYIVAAPHNCKSTFGGHILKSAGIVPLPSSIKGARPFDDMMKYMTDHRAAIHYYPEQSMWIDYKKPRPYKEGAFYYADRLDIPVVPMLYCFKPARGLRRLLHLPKAEIRIADPIYTDKSLRPRDRKADLAERAYNAAAALYRDFYGKELEYAVLEQSENTNKGTDE